MISLRNQKLVLATHNQGKVAEIKSLLQPFSVQIYSAQDFNLQEPAETEDSFAGNAMIKAKYVAEATQMMALSDDSGLSVLALDGAPGVYSADWAGEPRDFNRAMQRVQSELGSSPDRRAYFTSVLVLMTPSGENIVAEGRVDGHLVWPPRGQNGFGYDPIFVPSGETQTFGEMTPEDKKKFSHRARACAALCAALLEKLS